MDREQILRSDFPVRRKGWDPEAVESHLKTIADSATPSPGESLSAVASERVRTVIEAAERQADTIETEARASADEARARAREIVAEAEAEASQIVDEARSRAGEGMDSVQAAIARLVTEADQLRERIAGLDQELGETIGAKPAPAAEVTPPVVVPEPGPARIPEPAPDPQPEPTPDPVPEPTPDPVPEPTPDPEPEPEQPAADEPEEPADSGAPVTDEDLIAQIRAGAEPATINGDTGSEASGGENASIRLVAMSMALDGASREEVGERIGAEAGGPADADTLDALLDDVFARAGRSGR